MQRERRGLAERAAMARTAKGTSGRCSDYVRNIHVRPSELSIVDEDVKKFRGCGPLSEEELTSLGKRKGLAASNPSSRCWLRGRDLNQRPLGYESEETRGKLTTSPHSFPS